MIIQKQNLKLKTMKNFTLIIVLVFLAELASAQTEKKNSVSYEAVNWKTWLLKNPRQYSIDAPPGDSKTKSELQAIKQTAAGVDEKKIKDIKYWDSGAPSYRWNQIIPKVIGEKMEI